ncbi:MAG: hypothetical protein ACXWK4_03350 [Myxococcaceae bacterium]
MSSLRPSSVGGLVLAIGLVLSAGKGPPASAAEPAAAVRPARDGSHDFDFAFGRWKMRVRRLKGPLTGSRDWYEMSATTSCRPFWNGAGNVEEFEADGPTGHIQAVTVRMYSSTSRQWSLNWATSKSGLFGAATVGEFRDGTGEFFDQEVFEGRTILVRYVWSGITKNSAHFEQAFSDDGGKTWEVNWITDQTRIE